MNINKCKCGSEAKLFIIKGDIPNPLNNNDIYYKIICQNKNCSSERNCISFISEEDCIYRWNIFYKRMKNIFSNTLPFSGLNY